MGVRHAASDRVGLSWQDGFREAGNFGPPPPDETLSAMTPSFQR